MQTTWFAVALVFLILSIGCLVTAAALCFFRKHVLTPRHPHNAHNAQSHPPVSFPCESQKTPLTCTRSIPRGCCRRCRRCRCRPVQPCCYPVGLPPSRRESSFSFVVYFAYCLLQNTGETFSPARATGCVKPSSSLFLSLSLSVALLLRARAKTARAATVTRQRR